MAALNQDNARMRRELLAATAPSASANAARVPIAQPLGTFAAVDDEKATAVSRRSSVAADLRRELAAAAEVERLRGLLADAAATAATREAELHAELESQVRC